MLCKNRLKSDKIKENQGIKIHEFVFFRWRAQGRGGTRHGRAQGTVKGAGTRHRPYNMGIGKGVGYDMILVGLILYLTIAIEFFQNF